MYNDCCNDKADEKFINEITNETALNANTQECLHVN